MTRSSRLVKCILSVALFVAMINPAFAHHGWTWADDEQTELSGVISRITMAPPHPVLEVNAEGRVWRVELDDIRQSGRSGFSAAAKVGDSIVVLGHRHADKRAHIKAVRVTVEGIAYDVYPSLIRR